MVKTRLACIEIPEEIIGMVSFDPTGPGKPRDHRFEFISNEAAKMHRRNVGCGGWVLGRFLFPGTGWTPSRVMLNCPDAGVLE